MLVKLMYWPGTIEPLFEVPSTGYASRGTVHTMGFTLPARALKYVFKVWETGNWTVYENLTNCSAVVTVVAIVVPSGYTKFV